MTTEQLEWGPDEGAMPWHEAVAFAATKGDGWRLPTVPELVAQFDYDKDAPKGEGWKRGWYWSSSAYAGNTTLAWSVHFYVGYTGSSVVGYSHRVRCVRSVGGELAKLKELVASCVRNCMECSYAVAKADSGGRMTALEKLEAMYAEWEKTGSTARAEQVADAFPLVAKALREAWAKNDKAHEVIQMILEGDMLKPEAYEPWGEEESIRDACKRIVTTWELP